MTKQAKKVTVALAGGLGNQMFQYAAGMALADRLNCELSLDVTWFTPENRRSFALRSFKIFGEDVINWSYWPPYLRQIFYRVARKWFREIGGLPVWRESHFHYMSGFKEINEPVFLVGYWQSEKYFSHLRPLLLEQFCLRNELPRSSQFILEKILSVDSICVHVRRGDYLSNSTASKIYGTCSLEYYKESVLEIRTGLLRPHCFIFTDDPEWVDMNLKLDCPSTLVNVNSSSEAIYDLVLMASCKHFVIANSSLSWWGAWLSQNPDKLVIAPERWFIDSRNDTRDLLPSAWLRRRN